ncbi:MAG: proline--tRNA ligase [Bacilli bacterium]|nr:proline--tRNA ligase [Bacilli bacterium]
MKQSMMFIPTLREMPKDAEIASHQILLKGGYMKQHAAGIYTYLPLAYKIIQKIEVIVREELNRIGCSELFMPALQSKDLWIESGRWEVYGKELMRLTDRHEREFCLGPTHEEIITAVARDSINSYKKLPLALYQIQTKFRDEFRPRFGLMRGREFIMKDLYTFHATPSSLDEWYLSVREAYIQILNRLDLHYRIVSAASGQIGGKSSEEFMVLCDIGEDTIVYSDQSNFASNVELCDLAEGSPSPDGVGIIRHAKGIEVGHIFKLGTKYSEPMNFQFVDEAGKKNPVIMGCYGMGISRLIMAVLEQHNTNLKVVWPQSITPFDIHVIPMDKPQTLGYQEAMNIVQLLEASGFDVLVDDRNETAGVKFNDADLIGIRYRVIVGRKVSEGIVEVKDMLNHTTQEVLIQDLKNYQWK